VSVFHNPHIHNMQCVEDIITLHIDILCVEGLRGGTGGGS